MATTCTNLSWGYVLEWRYECPTPCSQCHSLSLQTFSIFSAFYTIMLSYCKFCFFYICLRFSYSVFCDYLNRNLTFCDTYFAFLLHLHPTPQLAVPLFTSVSSWSIIEYSDLQILPKSLMHLLTLSVMVECKCFHIVFFFLSDSVLLPSFILL